MKVAALLVSIALLGCFPNNPRHRTIAKYVEGGALVAGIALSAVANTGADCDAMMMAGPDDNGSCRTTATVLGTTGMALILGGLLGFVATISTAEDAEVRKIAPTVVPVSPQPTPVPDGAATTAPGGPASAAPPPSGTASAAATSAASSAPSASEASADTSAPPRR